ncbi:uncharacterized protein LOC106871838 [Octopus bimaculoides]|uniref:Lipocalin/cytosolic fatty-acid binding domain-containing protein n=1 Tax=Octopus bimaculoides TaxID=37653 RepID=A0A0L8IDS8_OCTBM|nr:uncharacterized protein LOC106871838 [Octopus bimaculoides]|eukprot:XP_014774045.1 PREDICTED: uncharacterized protein LOC106871838 [Octopus bimaculoides]
MSCGIVLLFVTVVSSLVIAAPLNKEVPFNLSSVNQMNFDFSMFSGTWHTIWKSKKFVHDDSINIESKEFSSNSRGSISFVETDARENKLHSTPVTGVAKTDKNITVRIVSTDYNSTALLIYCTDLTESTCHPDHYYFEIASRTRTMEPDDEIRILTEINTVSGRFEEMTYLGADCEGDSVVFDSIPVTASFSLDNILGNSFALAQTNFTGAKPLLAHSIYLPQINQIVGWFTILMAISDNKTVCNPVMRSMTKVSPDNNGILYSKIGHFEIINKWNIAKTLYSDRHYTLSYFCFEEYNRSCSRNRTEVRLDSRQREIDPNFKRTLFQLLQKVCLTADSMKNIEYKINCSSNLNEVVNKEQVQFKNPVNGVCQMENMPIADYNHGKTQLDGIWYVIAALNSIPGSVVNITTLPDTLIIDRCTPKNNTCQWKSRSSYTQICPGKAKFMETYLNFPGTNFSTIYEHHMAYIDEDTHFIYSCPEESTGKCDANGVSLMIYSRRKQTTHDILEKLKNFQPFLCLNISHLNTVEFPSLNFTEPTKLTNNTHTTCSVENIPGIENYNQSKLLGTWYEVAHSDIPDQIGKRGPNHTHRVQFYEDTDGHLKLGYQHDSNKTDTSGAFVGDIQPQCVYSLSGHFTSKYTFSALVKIIYTDYDNLTIIFVCTFTNYNGECYMPMVHIMSRKLELTTHMLGVAESVFNKVCIHPDNIQIVQDVSASEVNHSCNTVKSTDWKKERQSR